MIMGWRVPAKREFNAWPSETRSLDLSAIFLRTAAKIADEYERSRGRGIESGGGGRGKYPSGWMLRSLCSFSASFPSTDDLPSGQLSPMRYLWLCLENWLETRLHNNYVETIDVKQWYYLIIEQYLIFESHFPTKIANIASAIIHETRRKLLTIIIIIIIRFII